MFTKTRLAGLLIVAGLVGVSSRTLAAPLLELTVGNNAYVGKSLAHDKSVCWLAQQDGRVTEVSLNEVTSFRTIDKKFKSLKTIDIRNQLRREFGRGWEITSTGHYLVCAPQGRARLFAKSFEDLYRSFRSYFSRRGFRLPQPEFPMIAVVYPTVNEFAANCAKDGVPFVPGLKGYYHRLSNRTNLFESGNDQLAAATPNESTGHGLPVIVSSRRRDAATFEDLWRPTLEVGIWGGVSPTSGEGRAGASRWSTSGFPEQTLNQPLEGFAASSFRGPVWDGNIQADLKDTIVHEATHQVAYNLGLHSRIGDNPKWITEGLATMFEAEGTRKNTGGRRPAQRLNQERFERFADYVQRRREQRSLAKFIMSDRLFQRSVLDAYAQAWAVTFFLAETRSSKQTKYLKAVSARDPMKPYTAEERLADFQAAFGNDLDRLEVSFLRFMGDLR